MSNLDQASRVKTSMEIAIRIVSSYLKVTYPVADRLLIQSTCPGTANPYDLIGCTRVTPDFTNPNINLARAQCGQAVMNPNHFSAYQNCNAGANGSSCITYQGGLGETTDYYMYITAVQDPSQCNVPVTAQQTVVKSTVCGFDVRKTPVKSIRPAMANINFCPSFLAIPQDGSDSAYSDDDLVEITVRELLRALGFSFNLMQYWLDGSGVPRKDTYAQSTHRVTGETIMVVTAAKLLALARKYFGCDSINFIPLENTDPTFSSWEANYLRGDIMAGLKPQPNDGSTPVISRFTLTFMEESGWYVADPTMTPAELTWGKGAGCLFLADCITFAKNYPANPWYCTLNPSALNQNETCDSRFVSQVTCQAVQTDDTDGCPVMVKTDAGSGKSCLEPVDANAAKVGASASPTSRCVNIVLPMSLGSSIVLNSTNLTTTDNSTITNTTLPGTNVTTNSTNPNFNITTDPMGLNTTTPGVNLTIANLLAVPSPPAAIQYTPTFVYNSTDNPDSLISTMCFEPLCDNSQTVKFAILPGAPNIVCKKAGQVIDLGTTLPSYFLSGQVICPDPNALCASLVCQNQCGGDNGYCVSATRKCNCRVMYSSPDCNSATRVPLGLPFTFPYPAANKVNVSVCVPLNNTLDEFTSMQYTFAWYLGLLFNVSVARSQQSLQLNAPPSPSSIPSTNSIVGTSGMITVCNNVGPLTVEEAATNVPYALTDLAQQIFAANLASAGLVISGQVTIDDVGANNTVASPPPPIFLPGMLTPNAPPNAAFTSGATAFAMLLPSLLLLVLAL